METSNYIKVHKSLQYSLNQVLDDDAGHLFFEDRTHNRYVLFCTMTNGFIIIGNNKFSPIVFIEAALQAPSISECIERNGNKLYLLGVGTEYMNLVVNNVHVLPYTKPVDDFIINDVRCTITEDTESTKDYDVLEIKTLYKPYGMCCISCGKRPDQISEYIEMACEEGITSEKYVKLYEGTYNHNTGMFYCTDCYIKHGSPIGKAW